MNLSIRLQNLIIWGVSVVKFIKISSDIYWIIHSTVFRQLFLGRLKYSENIRTTHEIAPTFRGFLWKNQIRRRSLLRVSLGDISLI